MIQGKKVLALIPARGGSKGVPGKNLRKVGGKSLLAWTIDAAKASKYIDSVVLSSDSLEIITAAKQLGCSAPFVRPAEFARDESPGIDPVLHALGELPGFDYLVLLQPTSPLRTAEDIDHCLESVDNAKGDFCMSIAPSSDSPFWMYFLGDDHRLVPVINDRPAIARRQLLPPTFVPNGAVYVGRVPALVRDKTFLTATTIGVEMPSARSLDIDTEADFQYLDFLLSSKR